MLQVGGHVDPGASLSRLQVFAQADAGLALHELQHGRLRCRVFGKLLALAESEDNCLDSIKL